MAWYTHKNMYTTRGRLLFFLAVLILIPLTIAYADTDPPAIENVTVSDISETSVRINWTTDEDADSLINYGLKSDYGIVRDPLPERREHEIILDDLEPGRVYYFRVVSSDVDGNQGISADYQVSTEGATSEDAGSGEADGQGQGEGQSQAQAVQTEEIIQSIEEITSQQQLEEILNEVVNAIQGITEDLTIVGPPTVVAETTTATISWTTDRAASSEVVFSPASEYTPGTYSYSQSSTGGQTTDHEVRLIGLSSFTEYHFKVRSTDTYNITGESRDYTFRTKASLPEIRNLRIVKVEEDSATLAWDTTVPAKALIEYQDLTTGNQNSVGRPSLATSNQLRIDGLTLGTRYVAFVTAENAGGDRVRSSPITFITVRDREPPIISNVTNESTLFPGSEARIQTIIEWLTDEPALCTLAYREGISAGTDPIVREPEDRSYKERHVEVIVDFAPATVYAFWLTCLDEAGNSVDSEDFVLFTPVQEKNIIDIIIENFEGAFGWVKNIGG